MKRASIAILAILAAVPWVSAPALAQSGADDLLNSLEGKSVVKIKPENRTAEDRQFAQPKVDFSDPFQRQLFAQIETTANLPYDVRLWTNSIFSGNYEQAGHLWTSIQGQIPETFQTTARAAYLYILWHLKLPQTFFDEFVENLSRPSFESSPSVVALETRLSSGFDDWMINNDIEITPEQAEALTKLKSDSPMVKVMKASAMLRTGEAAQTAIMDSPVKSRTRLYLAQTAALALARKHDLIGAAKILKLYEEPALNALDDPEIYAHYDLTIARLLFQAGQLNAAKEYFKKVPNTSPDYLEAQVELTWTLLRMGATPELRGELKSLTLPLYQDKFSPEISLLSAISDLKMCYYDRVQKDFQRFSSANQSWAKKIDAAITASKVPVPPSPDAFSRMAAGTVSRLAAEKIRLEQLEKESITAVLPAVGPQKHWKDAADHISKDLDLAEKNQDNEYRRQWFNDRNLLAEAVRKMRFVKVEYLGELNRFSTSASAPGASLNGPAVKAGPDQLVFPIDRDIWPDELFKMRSAAQSRCLAVATAR